MKYNMVSAREIVGKRITAFDPRPYRAGSETGKSRLIMHDPIITLDDGSILVFHTEEHPDGGEYGAFIQRVKRRRA